MENKNLAGVFQRVKAATIDLFFLMMLLYSAMVLFNAFDGENSILRSSILVLIVLLYEPIMVSAFGASIGHMFCDIRVEKNDDSQNKIALHIAIIRFIVKTLLGTISLLTIGGDSKKRAIHDMIANSIVVYVGDDK
ncbi:RDD family protein [Lacinutrix sp. Bg11-31]|uniref:RDD family protein n=1 Tax=Lacinutrix sp. Bg11-31 TaxID=2057808 RepID=UPI000C31A07D|nr:RDD family protein [Lacinutrix sp. Bg11-31]AUC81825.1 RDD family protein [Lacinutrix sp. Bg11-31]